VTTALDLETAAPGVLLRVTRIKECVFMVCMQADAQVPLAVMAQYPETFRPAGNGAVQFGGALLFLAAGQPERLFAWLQATTAAKDGVA